MSIDGIGGPKGPGDITGPKGIGSADAVEKAESVREPFRVDAPEEAPPAEEARLEGDAAVVDAVRGVAAEVRAGGIPNLDVAFNTVVERIVEGRYPDMEVGPRRRLTRNLQRVLADDPGVGAALKQMLSRAVEE